MVKKTPKTAAVFQAPDSLGSDSDDDKRKRVSKRSYLTVNGGEADTIEEAHGARYSLLGGKSGEINFDELFQNEKFMRMCAIFGFHTKVGNVANTVLNDKENPGTPDDAADAIREFIDKASDPTNPVWADRTGGVGAKIDLDALAGAIVASAEKAGRTDLDPREVREKLENDKALVRKMRQVPEIAAEYSARVGKVVSLDDALSGL